MNSNIEVVEADGVATVTLQRPEALNALTPAMMVELAEQLERLGADPSVRAVVITGAGRAFCAGGDVELDRHPDQKSPWDYRALVRMFARPIFAIVGMEKPVIAAINGFAVGGGWDLALACDIRYASTAAKFREAFVQLGVMPELGGTYWLPRLAGIGRAKLISFTGDVITAEQAQRYGLVEELFAPEELLPAAAQLAARLAAGPTKAIGLTKLAFNAGLDQDFRAALDRAMALTPALLLTEDHREAAAAFLAKRKPTFVGH